MKRIISMISIMLLTVAVSGCSILGGSRAKKYQSYVKGLLDVNCKGEYDDYIKTTMEKKEDAEKLYKDSVEELAGVIAQSLGIEFSDSDSQTQDRLRKFIENMLKKTDYQVAEAKKDGDQYKVEVTIKPMDFWTEANKSLEAYAKKIEKKYANKKVDVNSDEFQKQYADEVLKILEESIDKIGYKDAITIQVPIKEGSKEYSVEEEDLNNLMGSLFYEESNSK